MKKNPYLNAIAILVPVALALFMGWLWSGQNKRLSAANADVERFQGQVASLREAIARAEAQPISGKTIAAEATPDEQAAFLTQLRVNASASKVQLVRYMNQGLQRPADPNKPQEPQLFKPVASNVEVKGSYDGVRAFAYSLLRANRLMNMTGVSWKRGQEPNTTTLSFTLVRYVTDPAPMGAATAMAAGADSSREGA